jgi:hypothetical protein
LTVRLRPPTWNSFSSLMAFCASSSEAISTNAKPRARPVARSRTSVHRFDRSGSSEQLLQLGFTGFLRQVSYIQLSTHDSAPLSQCDVLDRHSRRRVDSSRSKAELQRERGRLDSLHWRTARYAARSAG